MKIEDFVAYETIRGNVFKLLAEFYLMPDQDMLGKIHDLAGMLRSACPEAAGPIQQLRSICKNGCDIERLKVDYAKLFVGPYSPQAPPYGSLYLEDERRVMGDSSLHALGMYREAGLHVAQDFNDAPDHIAAELEFMYYLVFKEIEAIAGGACAIAADYVGKQKHFLETHLGVWISEFSARVMERAETKFYRSLANLTKVFVRSRLEEISEVLWWAIVEFQITRAREQTD
ncbi:MAG: molecular chaperone TorD family protein, partial [Desulfobacterales bacterium]